MHLPQVSVPSPEPRLSFSQAWHLGQRKYLYSLRFLKRTRACEKAVRNLALLFQNQAFSAVRRAVLRENMRNSV